MGTDRFGVLHPSLDFRGRGIVLLFGVHRFR